jgi:hypothetical protein
MRISKHMTIQAAAAIWDDPQRVHLGLWAQDFEVRLEELHPGHIATYEKARLAQVNYAVVWTEILALRALLKAAGIGEEIESIYTTPLDKVKLSAEELAGLPSRARGYIEYLEREISGLNAENDRMKGTIRKTNWGRRR